VLAAALLLYAVQASYSSDFDRALENVVFFYVPFALLFALLARVSWTPALLTQCLVVLVALAVVFAGIGFYEYATRHLLLNPKVIAANQFQSYFRVNSLFFDPNIYGRFLAIVMIALAATLIWARRARTTAATGVGLAVLWAGLLLTFSQSSFAALLAGLVVLGGLRWNAAWAARGALAAAVVGAVIVIAAPGAVHLNLGSSKSLDSATSGRSELVEGAAELFEAKPVAGHGTGSFSVEYRKRQDASTEKAVSASHTIPLTVAAEQGVIGLALYLALVVIALRTLLSRASGQGARAALAAAFVALLVHTMSYAAFLEDPLTWVILGAGLALSNVARTSPPGAMEERNPLSPTQT
jgi:O-antigen ligase